MPLFDCQLDHHPLVRIDADNAVAAKAEYFRRYAITGSTAAWNCKEVGEGPGKSPLDPAPVEPETWRERRKELGTLNDKPADAKPAAPAAPTKAESGGVNVDAALAAIHKEPS